MKMTVFVQTREWSIETCLVLLHHGGNNGDQSYLARNINFSKLCTQIIVNDSLNKLVDLFSGIIKNSCRDNKY